MGLFGKTTKDPKEQVSKYYGYLEKKFKKKSNKLVHGQDSKITVQEWTQKIRKESNQLDRQVRSIQREEEKVKRTLKQAASKNDRDTCLILAKEIVGARKAINRIHTTKAHMNSIQLQMKNQLATLRVAGSLQKSTEVMQAMQNLVRYPELAGIMREMSKEMMKAGILEEMLEETMESVEETEDMEEEAQKEVDRVLWEITNGKLGEAPLPPEDITASAAATSKVKTPTPTAVTADAEEDEEKKLQEMQSRLASLRS